MIKFRKQGDKIKTCPVRFCWRTVIHARAVDYPLLDPENDFGYSLSVECPKHGWQDKGSGWSKEKLMAAGLT